MYSLYCACLLMATAMAGVPANRRELYPFEVKCIQDNHLNAEEIQKIDHFDPMPLDDAAMLKMEECWIQELKLFDSNGKIDYVALKKAFEEYIATLNAPEQAAEKAKMQSYYSKIDACSSKTFEGASEAEIGIKLHNCIIKEMAGRKLHPIELKCIQEYNIDAEEIKKLSYYEFIPVDNQAMLKMQECFGKEINMFDSAGKIDYPALKKAFGEYIATLNTPEQAEEKSKKTLYASKIDICSSKTFEGASLGEIGLKLHNCIIKEMAGRELHPIELKCIQEYNIDAEEIKKLSYYEFIPVDNQAMLKMQECFGKEINMFDSDGKIDYPALKKAFGEYIATLNTPEQAEEKSKKTLYASKIDICSTKTFEGASLGEIGLKLHNCIIKEMAGRELHPIELKCIQEYKINAEEIKKLSYYEFIPVDNQAMLKMQECFGKEINMFDSTGKIDYPALKKAFEDYIATLNTPEQAEEKSLKTSYASKIDICSTKTFEGASSAEIGLKLHNCIVKEMVLRELYQFEVECMQENNLDIEDLQKFRSEILPVDNPAMLKLEECWIKKTNPFDSEGKLDPALIKKAYEEHIATFTTPEEAEVKAKAQLYYSKIDICGTKTFEGASQAEIGLKFHNCILKEMALRELYPFEVKCIQDNKLDIEEVQKYRNFKTIVPVDNDAMLHMQQCWINELNLFANGKLDYSVLKKAFEAYIATLKTPKQAKEKATVQSYYSKIDVCSTKAPEGVSQAQTAIKLHNCIVNEMALRELYPFELKCVKDNNLDLEEVQKIDHFAYMPVDNPTILKMEECWINEMNYFDSTGKIDYPTYKKLSEEYIATLNTPEKAEEKEKMQSYYSKIDACSSKTFEGACQAEIGLKFHNCIIEEMAS